MSYTDTERARAIAWKSTSPVLPDAARVAAPYRKPGENEYEFCLPLEFADHNLLPHVRSTGLELFDACKIPWHQGVKGGPTNHLLSSQVQCVNALGAMVHDPARIVAAFAGPLGTAEVLEIEDGCFLTFEYIGPSDLLNESAGGERTRGANCTSLDAAFLHVTADGVRELVLLEWKYTEHYGKRPDEPSKDEERRARYEALMTAPDSPVRSDAMSLASWFDDPIYQLMRQQLLAHELEKIGVLGVDRVRVAHVLPAANLEFQSSIHRSDHTALGTTVYEVWKAVLRHPDRWVSLDSDIFLDPAVTSEEYVARYG